MERTKIAQIFADQEHFGGREVRISGWARTIRDMKTFGFIELNDGSCFKNLQVVMEAAFTSRGCLAPGVRTTVPATVRAAPTFCPAISL